MIDNILAFTHQQFIQLHCLILWWCLPFCEQPNLICIQTQPSMNEWKKFLPSTYVFVYIREQLSKNSHVKLFRGIFHCRGYKNTCIKKLKVQMKPQQQLRAMQYHFACDDMWVCLQYSLRCRFYTFFVSFFRQILQSNQAEDSKNLNMQHSRLILLAHMQMTT